MKRPTIVWMLGLLLALSGCSRLNTDYGESRGIGGRTSLNGFGALRSAFERAGFRNRDVSRLSDRVRRTDVIVWTPKLLAPIDTSVTRWFDLWLRQGDRTLVYIVPDSGSEADYWQEAARLAPPEQRLEYRKRAGRSINERIEWRLNRSSVPSNGWFRIEPLQVRRQVEEPSLRGPLKSELEVVENAADESSQVFAGVEFDLEPFDPETAQGAQAGTNTGVVPTGPTGPTSGPWPMLQETQPTKTPVDYAPLLSSDDELTVVAEIHSPRWRNSKILVVAGGSLLTNYAFSNEENRRLADALIARSTPASESEPTAGFLTSDWQTIPVSEREPDAPRTSGMEMLTEWPISVVTMHGVVLGLIVCLMLLPIFGRPRKLRRSEPNSFGHHLDAVAALMKRVGGESYARGRISDYMKRMHGETSGPWVLPDRAAAVPAASLPRPGTERLPLKDASSISARSDTRQSNPDRNLNQDEASR